MRATAALLTLWFGSCAPVVQVIMPLPAAAPVAEVPAVAPKVPAGALEAAASADRAASEFEKSSLSASRSDLIRMMELSQDLQGGVRRLRRHPTSGNAAAVRAAARAVRAATVPQVGVPAEQPP